MWAPAVDKLWLRVMGPHEQLIPMRPLARGYFSTAVDGLQAGALYKFRLEDDREVPDPASRSQPEGPHGPSQVVSEEFVWNDEAWRGLALAEHVFYEIHAGTFTPEGTLDAIIPRLDELRDLGITAIELMPVAQFPGARNWGYDGTFPFAVHDSYGGAAALKRLVNACHKRSLAVTLDVVYNHLGPEGNYLHAFGPYFTKRYHTPWGEALNFDGAHSDEVRRYFIENALMWVTEFHVDALRLDAIHAIYDFSAQPFLTELTAAVHARAAELGRRIYVFPESDLNDARHVLPRERGGFAMDAQWNDDFHHALHTLLTGERAGYYEDFGDARSLARAVQEGFVFQGEYSRYRRRRHGSTSSEIPPGRLIVCSQNHDQVGNRLLGERLSSLVDFESLKLAAATVLLSPNLPLLFMGEEYGEPAPFQYFVSHTDAELVEAVRKGRAEEFARFDWQSEVPDPQAEETFARCRLHWELRKQGKHGILLAFYRELLRMRRELAPLRNLARGSIRTDYREEPPLLEVHRDASGERLLVFLHFGRETARVGITPPAGDWTKLLDSAEPRWQGLGSLLPESLRGAAATQLFFAPRSVALYRSQESGS